MYYWLKDKAKTIDENIKEQWLKIKNTTGESSSIGE
jgi:hypothetical protein